MLSVDRHALIRALKLHGAVVSARAIKPILQNVTLHVLSACEELVIRSTDLEVSLTTHTPCLGYTCDHVVPIARLLKLIEKSPGERIAIGAPGSDPSGRTCEIGTEAGSVKLMGEDPEEFPVIPTWDAYRCKSGDGITGGYCYDFTAGSLRRAIDLTWWAAAQERSRFAFNGVRFQIDGDSCFRAIATDGKRMSVYSVNGRDHREPHMGHIVPTKALKLLRKCLPAVDGELVYMGVDERTALWTMPGQWEIATKLVDGAFPKYESVVPAVTDTKITLNRAKLIQAVQFAKLLTNEESRSVQFALDEGHLVLTARATDVGEATSKLTGSGVGSGTYAFNPDFIIEGLEHFTEEEVTLGLSGKDTPARIDAAGADHTYVVMPVTMRKA